MMELLSDLAQMNKKKIVLFVLDGLGGLPQKVGGKTELESASTPNFDRLAERSECGLQSPLGIGITPGSAPGHLSLFGYNPFDYAIGRGVVAAMGIAFPMKEGDVAVRMNFASKDDQGNITDRRAGRIPTEKCAELCKKLKDVSIDGIEVFVKPVKDYRAVVIFRGEGLSDHVQDTDPQATGVKSLDPQPGSEKGIKTAKVASSFISQANDMLQGERPANTVLMRGFAELPHIPSLKELYRLSALALAVYPDYKGVSRLVGMDVIEGLGDLEDQGRALRDSWQRYDYFYVHHKYTDSKGEDGDFNGKVKEIEKCDAFLPQILNLHPDVLIVTGDHSTPSVLKSHSGHPVPFIISSDGIRTDSVTEFGERSCAHGLFGGGIDGTFLMRLALCYSGKLAKFGA
jgi:2,3-bisphosphoglycerate-independent phosphoglycerate mutase